MLKITLTGQAMLEICGSMFPPVKRVKRAMLSENDQIAIDSNAVGEAMKSA